MNSTRVFLLSMVLLLSFVPSFAQQLYVTNESGQQLEKMDLATGKISPLYAIGGRPDSLILNSLGQIIYDVPSWGLLAMYDPSTKSNTVLATGLKYPRDFAFDPSGTSMLIALYAVGRIARYNLISGTVTTLPTHLGTTVDGLAYDLAGDLFAIVSHNTICQVDPASGAILKTLVLEPHFKVNGGDGIVYDPYSQQLWVTHDGTQGNGLIEIPTDLSGFTLFQTGSFRVPDGIASDGKGNLYIGAGYQIVVYNIPSDTVTKKVSAPGADSVALIPGTF